MRLAMLAAPAIGPIINTVSANGAFREDLPLLLSDRIANGEAFPGERLVRLPRRFSRAPNHWMAIMAAQREFSKP